MYDVTAFGELLIDFTPCGAGEEDTLLFERNPGGAPANVSVCVSKLGGRAALISKVGNDIFGHFLKEVLERHDVETRGLLFSDTVKTTLAFVQLDRFGERTFSFYRNPGADTTIEPGEIDYGLIKNSKVFHFGSLSLTDEPSRSALLAAADFAVKSGCIISYDPNLRIPLWRNLDEARNSIISMLPYADILKVSLEEMEFITGEQNLEKGSLILSEKYGLDLVIVTLGKDGSAYRTGNTLRTQKAFDRVKAVDTTGAGDAFLGAFLYSVTQRDIKEFKAADTKIIDEMMNFANAAAALCVMKKGAIPAMPDLETVKKLMDG